LYVVTGKPPPLTDAAAFTSYVTKNNAIGVTTKLVDQGPGKVVHAV
jgi:hypothetical protein